MFRYVLGLLLTSTCYVVAALDVAGKIPWNDLCSGSADLGHAKVILDDGLRYYGGVARDGAFLIPNVKPGTYLLSVVAHDHSFDRVRIDIVKDSLLPEVRPHVPGTPLSPPSSIMLPYPISLPARRKNEYFAPPESFNLMGMLQNPMMLMMIVVGGMVFVMPYMMKNMDPESLKEFNERHAKMTGIQSSIQSGDLKSGLSQLLAASEEAPSPAPKPNDAGRQKTTRSKRR